MNAPLFGLMGYAQAGKDTFGAALGYRRFAFADVLKAVAYDTQDEMGKSYIDKVGWDRAKQHEPWRVFLQNLGVAVRTHLSPDAWVDAAFRHYNPSEPTVFTDVRFPNEVEAIRSRGGQIIKIVRTGHKPANGHVSEAYCDQVTPDFTVTAADGDVASLVRKAQLFTTSFFVEECWS